MSTYSDHEQRKLDQESGAAMDRMISRTETAYHDGEWIKRGDGYWALRVPNRLAALRAENERLRTILAETLTSLEYWYARGKPEAGRKELAEASPSSTVGRARAALKGEG